MTGHREVVFLDREGVAAAVREEACGGHDGVASGVGQDLDLQGLVGPALVGPVVGRACADEEVLVRAQQQDGALGRRTREVSHIGGTGDQRARAAAGAAPFLQPFAASRVHL
jgi:hypothetical protein